jgi:UDP-N-acetylglucosamine--N-acetylmuramyl-(pentapeptide) pyrophosphoryl-undecaprenol N-acetylglucosamine transferase
MEFLWVGGEGGMEARLVERAGIPFKTIPAAGVHGVELSHLPGNIATILRGTKIAGSILAEFQPDVLFFTGGYVAVPVALAGRKIPSLLYVPDIEPGLALKALAYFASCITVTSEESKQYFSPNAKVVVTGYPVRADLTNWTKADARDHFAIKSNLPVVLVFGGSKGAHSINLALHAHLSTLLEHVEVIHISGELDWSAVGEILTRLPRAQWERYHAFPYLHEDMGAALAVADLAVSRAGASVLGEFPQFALPAILVPYPYAWRYQKINADALAKRGAALMIEDAKLKSGLYLTIEKLLETPEKLDAMRAAMIAMRSPNAAEDIAAQLLKLAGDKHD